MQQINKQGNEKAVRLINKPFHNFSQAVLISGGLCKEGLGQIICH